MRQRLRITGKNNSIVIGSGNVVSNSLIQSRGITQVGRYMIDTNARMVMMGHTEIPFHKKMTGNNIVAANDHLIIDGYKLMPDKTWQSVHTAPAKGLWTTFMKWLKGEK